MSGLRVVSVAEREGFEPSVPVRAHTISSRAPSASSAISPQGVLDVAPPFPGPVSRGRVTARVMAEREGFEPPIPRQQDAAFRERCLQPLGHLSCKVPGMGLSANGGPWAGPSPKTTCHLYTLWPTVSNQNDPQCPLLYEVFTTKIHRGDAENAKKDMGASRKTAIVFSRSET